MRSAITLSLPLIIVAGCAAHAAPLAPSTPVCTAAPAAADAPKAETPPAKTGDTAASKAASVDGVKDEVVRRLNAHDIEGLYDLFGPTMKAAVPLPAAKSFISGILAEHGAIVSVTRDPHLRDERHGIYLVAMERKPAQMDIQLDETGRIIGLNITDPPPAEPVVARSDLPIALPFHGTWTVVAGGDRVEVNRHIGNKSQRRAADLVVVGENGKTFRTDGKTNADYLAYGRDVNVVAAGTIIEIVDGVVENVPGAMNPYVAPGNFVIVKHGPSLYSVYAHLQPGSIRLKVGAAVKQGDVVGRCGNTGNSSEPHIHFQLQDGPLFENSWGVEPLFHDVTATRSGKTEPIHDYAFFKGDVVVGPPVKK